ncbi:MAG: D-alanine--D-alanine ligase [Chloroflexi bacterium]|nr:D-alanine--D-alanine ligase [Chloroflexota bacterium]
MKVSGAVTGSVGFLGFSASAALGGHVYETRDGMAVVKDDAIVWTNISLGTGSFQLVTRSELEILSTYSPPLMNGFNPSHTAPGDSWSETVDITTTSTTWLNGTMQGLLELADIPYVGAGVLGSALGMDKIAMKAAFAQHDLPIVPFLALKRKDWERDPEAMLDRVAARFGYPCFVKPANLGSSVGITKAHDRDELRAALALAAAYDRKMLAEESIDAREIECSVLGNDDPIASVPGEVIPSREFYDYAAKYVDEDSELLIPAPIGDERTRQVRELAVRAFLALDLAGMARVDFFLERGTDRLYLNEVNTIPGFTSISMYPKLWAASGVSYTELITRLIELALERHADKQRSRTSY